MKGRKEQERGQKRVEREDHKTERRKWESWIWHEAVRRW